MAGEDERQAKPNFVWTVRLAAEGAARCTVQAKPGRAAAGGTANGPGEAWYE
jgi:hypothetical protein